MTVNNMTPAEISKALRSCASEYPVCSTCPALRVPNCSAAVRLAAASIVDILCSPEKEAPE